MSITDARLIFADPAEFGTSGATAAFTSYPATNTINLGAKDLDIGAGTPLYLNILVITSPTNWRTTYDTTCSFVLQGCDTLSVPDTGPNYNIKKLTPGESLSPGFLMRQALPASMRSKHLRLKFVTGAQTAMTFQSGGGGAYKAWISPATPETDVGT